jgi:hypothetical protein
MVSTRELIEICLYLLLPSGAHPLHLSFSAWKDSNTQDQFDE